MARSLGRWETRACPRTKDMPPCLAEWHDSIPAGWKEYAGLPSVFHCGFDGIVADCEPAGDRLQQECFYNEMGKLVDDRDIDWRCAGTPNADDAKEHPLRHIFSEGGIKSSGLEGYVGTFLHAHRAGGGGGPMPFLARYAKLRGLDAAQIERWVNRLGDKAWYLSNGLLRAARDCGSNPDRFTADPAQETVLEVPGEGLTISTTLLNTVSGFEQYLRSEGIPLP